MLYPFDDILPQLGRDVFIAPGAAVIGDVTCGDETSIWYNSVLRGDVMPIRIGARVNIQDLSVVHVTSGVCATHIADDVTVGHRAIIHGCVIEEACLIGMGAIVMDGAVIGAESLIGAGSLITPGTRIPPRSLVMGSPGKVRRQLDEAELASLRASAAHYVDTARRHFESLTPLGR